MTHYYDNPESSDHSFEERVGAEHAGAGIEHVLLCFNSLNLALSRTLTVLKAFALAISNDDIDALGFEAKLELVSTVVRSHAHVAPFNVGRDEPIACWEIIEAQCLRSAVLHHQVLGLNSTDSCWRQDDEPGVEDHEDSRPWDAAKLLDIADYIANVNCFIEEFFLLCGPGSIWDAFPTVRTASGETSQERRQSGLLTSANRRTFTSCTMGQKIRRQLVRRRGSLCRRRRSC